MAGRKCRFVQPEVEHIDLSDGDWIEIRKRLNVGEIRKMQLGGVKMKSAVGESEESKQGSGMEIVADLEQFGIAKVAAYLLDWNLVDKNDKTMPYTEEALKNLDESSYKEIEGAINKHTEAQEAADAPKKTKSSSGKSKATSR